VDDSCPVALAYAYELRQDDEIVATGRVTTEAEIEVGDELRLAGLVYQVVCAAGSLVSSSRHHTT